MYYMLLRLIFFFYLKWAKTSLRHHFGSCRFLCLFLCICRVEEAFGESSSLHILSIWMAEAVAVVPMVEWSVLLINYHLHQRLIWNALCLTTLQPFSTRCLPPTSMQTAEGTHRTHTHTLPSHLSFVHYCRQI